MPVAPGCYVLTNAVGEVIYLGQATSLRDRLLTHFGSGRHREPSSYGCISLVSILRLDNPAQLNAHERGWLQQCVLLDGVLPPLNKVAAPI
jgi:excinuclease UvrABC nuclease subunit